MFLLKILLKKLILISFSSEHVTFHFIRNFFIILLFFNSIGAMLQASDVNCGTAMVWKLLSAGQEPDFLYFEFSGT